MGSEFVVVDGVISDVVDDIVFFNSDWMNKYCGYCRLVFKLGIMEEVSKIFKYCNDNMLVVVF